jgi:hypothetical protein
MAARTLFLGCSVIQSFKVWGPDCVSVKLELSEYILLGLAYAAPEPDNAWGRPLVILTAESGKYSNPISVLGTSLRTVLA